jgi:Flp pilus assembly pilin Flp
MIMRKARIVGDRKGANLIEYGLLLGLLAIASIGTVAMTGETVKSIFSTTESAIALDPEGAPEMTVSPDESCIEGGMGTVCDDGAIYAGDFDGVPFFVAGSDAIDSRGYYSAWYLMRIDHAYGYEHFDTSSMTDGSTNTENYLKIAEAKGVDSPAIGACKSFGDEWYLPGYTQLRRLIDMRDTLGSSRLVKTEYVTSTSNGGARNYLIRVNDSSGGLISANHESEGRVRCGRGMR